MQKKWRKSWGFSVRTHLCSDFEIPQSGIMEVGMKDISNNNEMSFFKCAFENSRISSIK